MAFCINCGRELTEGANFCANCGKAVNGSNSTEQRKTVYDGEIHKCPNCGETIDAYDMVCKACGYEVRGRKTTSVVHELALKLEKTFDADKKEELIRTFYIPNTREDIHEFFILALSNIKIGGTNTDAWMVKIEQAYQKAELTFGDAQEFERLRSLYDKAHAMNKKRSTFKFFKAIGRCFKSGYAWAVLAFTLGIILLISNGGEASMPSIYLLLAGALIAEFTFIGKDNEKKKGKKKKE